jgi:hypothetical protein
LKDVLIARNAVDVAMLAIVLILATLTVLKERR